MLSLRQICLELCLLYSFQNAAQNLIAYQCTKSNRLQTQISPSRQCWVSLLFAMTKVFVNSAAWISVLFSLARPSRQRISIFWLLEIVQNVTTKSCTLKFHVSFLGKVILDSQLYWKEAAIKLCLQMMPQ